MPPLTQQRIVVTGGAGFLGRAVVKALRERKVPESAIFVPRSREYNLTTQDAVRKVYKDAFGGSGPTLVIHCAGFVGGINANRRFPGRFFTDNLLMPLNLLTIALERGFVGRGMKFVQIGTMCSYPADASIPYKEESLWKGYPDPAAAAYGVSKLAAWQLLDAYRAEHGMKSAYVIPVNLFGPGDNISHRENSHVAGALVRTFVEAAYYNEPEVVCWGTGSPTRDFVYMDDAAEGVVRAAEELDVPDPVNLAGGTEVSIRQLAELISRLAGYKGRITWDTSKPDGQMHRSLDISRAKKLLGWEPRVSLEEGLHRTVEWYKGVISS